jgi:hypothetical protein
MADTPIVLRLTIADPVPGVRYSLQKDDAPVLPGRGRDGSPACATVRPTVAWRPV